MPFLPRRWRMSGTARRFTFKTQVARVVLMTWLIPIIAFGKAAEMLFDHLDERLR